jgi:hypothetical protein
VRVVRSACCLVVTVVVVSGGCTAPREKDCKAIVPILDDARASRTFALGDAGLGATRFADRPRRIASDLRALTIHDPPVKDAVGRFLSATDRYASAMAALDELVSALKLQDGSGPDLRAVDRAIQDARPDVERLLQRCAINVASGDERRRQDCLALEHALARCVTPSQDDTTAEELLLTCAAAIDGVPTTDLASRDALMRVARALRAVEPFAREVRAPAKEVVANATRLAPKITVHTSARTDAERADAEIRAICQPGAAGGTRGPS